VDLATERLEEGMSSICDAQRRVKMRGAPRKPSKGAVVTARLFDSLRRCARMESGTHLRMVSNEIQLANHRSVADAP
jgi:hypothetical protein